MYIHPTVINDNITSPALPTIGKTIERRAMLVLLVFCTLLGCPFTVFSQITAQPVPSKWLREGKLIPEGFNFSIDSPDPDSEWSYAYLPDYQGSKWTLFTVDMSMGRRFAITVLDKSGEMGPESTRKFVHGFQESMPKDWSVGEANIEPSAFPLKDSSRFKIEIHLPNDSVLYAYGYILTGIRLYVLLDYTVETTEPRQFTQFVSSFTFLSPNKSEMTFHSYALWIGVTLAFQGLMIWISVKAKPLGDKPYRWGTYTAITTGLVGFSFLLITFSSVDPYGKAGGAVLGISAILSCIGLLRRHKFGVVMFYITYISLIVGGPVFEAVRNQAASAQKEGQVGLALVFLVLTAIYLKKRWALMGTPKNPSPTPLPVT
ncbi:MAG TPA: hypothetical protein VKR82_16885 [Candidatus Acidoferrales bacterium]|nr:hypothetical protein [Candidatus Acidoferrales bacterium]